MQNDATTTNGPATGDSTATTTTKRKRRIAPPLPPLALADLPDLATKVEAARFLRSKVRTVDFWISSGSIAAICKPGYVRFRKEDLITFVNRHRVEATSAPECRRPRRRKAAASA